MLNKEQQADALEMIRKGTGKKVIAKKLNTTEWQIRRLASAFVRDAVRANRRVEHDNDSPEFYEVDPEGRETVIFASDFHIPFHDKKALDVLKGVIESIRPTKLILGGDVVDFYEVSSHRKDPMRLTNLQDEVDETVAILEEIVSVAKNSEVLFIEGNHEARLSKFLSDKAPELASLRTLDICELLHLNQLKIRYVKRHIRIGDLLYIHGDRTNKHSGYAAKAHLEDMGISVMFGHGHRMGMHYKYNWGGDKCAIENGMLCDRSQKWLGGKVVNWQHGFMIIEYYGNEFWVEPVQIKNGRALVRGTIHE